METRLDSVGFSSFVFLTTEKSSARPLSALSAFFVVKKKPPATRHCTSSALFAPSALKTDLGFTTKHTKGTKKIQSLWFYFNAENAKIAKKERATIPVNRKERRELKERWKTGLGPVGFSSFVFLATEKVLGSVSLCALCVLCG
jgi:hypothetical protein